MRKIALAVAALAIAGFAAPMVQTAQAETVIVKKDRHHDRDWGLHHHKKVVIIKRGRHHDHE